MLYQQDSLMISSQQSDEKNIQWDAEKRIRENYGSRTVLESCSLDKEWERLTLIRTFGLEQIPASLKIERIENWRDRGFIQVINNMLDLKIVSKKTIIRKIKGLSRSTQGCVSLN